MATQLALSRLDELSRQYGSKDKELALSNLAHNVLTLLQGKNGSLKTEDKDDLSTIADIVVKIGNRHFEPGDPDDNLAKRRKGLSRGGLTKPSGVRSLRSESKQRD